MHWFDKANISNLILYVGKLIENVLKYVKYDFVESDKKAKSLVKQPTYQRMMPINDNLVVLERKKIRVHYNKPIYAGFSVLEVSKIIMYEFHYNYIKK